VVTDDGWIGKLPLQRVELLPQRVEFGNQPVTEIAHAVSHCHQAPVGGLQAAHPYLGHRDAVH